MTKTLAIYCSGGLGLGVFDLAKRINQIQAKWQEIVFIDDIRQEKEYYGTKVYSYTEFSQKYKAKDSEIVIGHGEPAVRKSLYEKTKDYSLATLIDNTCVISPSARIEAGVILYPFAYIASLANIQSNTIVCSHSTIGHHSQVAKHCVLVGHVNIAGHCTIGETCYLGMGAQVKDRINIGEFSLVGMGAVVLKDVAENVRVLGNPARIIVEN